MNFQAFMNSIKKELAPIYLLTGEETFLLENARRELITTALGVDDLNLIIFDCEVTPIQVAVQECLTIPFMSFGKKVVVAKDANFLSTNKTKIEHDLKTLENYMKNPCSDTVFIMIAPYEKLDGRKKIVKQLQKEVVTLEATPLNEREFFSFVEEQSRTNKVKIEYPAIGRLMQLVGTDLTQVVSELRKLTLHVGIGGVITTDVVDELVTKNLEQNVFLLTESFSKKQIGKTLEILSDLLLQGEQPIKILALLARQVRIMLLVSHLTNQGVNSSDIAKQLGLHPYVVKITAGQIKFFPLEQLEYLLNLIAEADIGMKTGKNQRLLLETIILKAN